MRNIAVGSTCDPPNDHEIIKSNIEPTAHIDSIKWLKDPDLFYHELSKGVHSNVSQSAGNARQGPLTDKDFVINALGTR